jgi:hypothetical protein
MAMFISVRGWRRSNRAKYIGNGWKVSGSFMEVEILFRLIFGETDLARDYLTA